MELLMALLEILIVIVSIWMQVFMAVLNVAIDVLMLVVDVIMPIFTFLLNIITLILGILIFIVGLFFGGGGSSAARAKRNYVPPNESELIKEVFGPLSSRPIRNDFFDYNDGGGGNNFTTTSSSSTGGGGGEGGGEMGVGGMPWFINQIGKSSHSYYSGLYHNIQKELESDMKREPLLFATMHSQDPVAAINAFYRNSLFQPLSHDKIVHAMEIMGFGPEHDFPPGDPARYDWGTNIVQNTEDQLMRSMKRVKRDPGAHEEVLKRRRERYHDHSANRRALVMDRLSQASQLASGKIASKYSEFRDQHATDEVIEHHISNLGFHLRNKTGFESVQHVAEWMHGFITENNPTRYGFDHFLHTISPSHHPIHQALQKLDPDRSERLFWNEHVAAFNLTNFNTTTYLFVGHAAHRRIAKRMEFSILATTDCFGSEPRNPLCLPEIPANFTLCPPKLCFPFDINEAFCDMFGYTSTRCVFCFARLQNALKAISFIALVVFKAATKFIFNIFSIFPFLEFEATFLDLDATAVVGNVLCFFIHLYDIWITIAFLYALRFWIWPLIMVFINCVQMFIQAARDNEAYLSQLESRDEESNAIDRELRRFTNKEIYRRGRSTYFMDGGGQGNIAREPVMRKEQVEKMREDNFKRDYGVSKEEYWIDRYGEDPRISSPIGELIEAHSSHIRAHKDRQWKEQKFRSVKMIGSSSSTRTDQFEQQQQQEVSIIDDDTESMALCKDNNSLHAMKKLHRMCQNDLSAFEIYTTARFHCYNSRLKRLFGMSDRDDSERKPGAYLSRNELSELEDLNGSLVQIQLHHMGAWISEIEKNR